MIRASRGLVALLLVLDLALVLGAFSLGYLLRFHYGVLEFTPVDPPPSYGEYLQGIAFACLVFAVVFRAFGLYRGIPPRGIDVLQSTLGALSLSTVLVLAASFFYREFSYSRSALLIAWAVMLFTLPVPRVWLMRWRRARYARGKGLVPAVIVGTSEAAQELYARLSARGRYGLDVLGVVTDGEASDELPVLGPISELESILAARGAREVLIPDSIPRLELFELLEVCARQGVEARVVPRLYDLFVTRNDLNELYGVPFIAVREARSEKLSLALKRVFDLGVGLLLASLSLPILILTAIAIRLESSGPALFRQQRIGQGGRPFGMWKLRSMVVDAEAQRDALVDVAALDQPVYKLEHDPRVTRVGRVIRRWSIDELPQLWNVVVGDMSLVGPRPEEESVVALYDAHQRRRLKAKPGLTGLQQVEARASTDLDERIQLDVYYLRKRSFLFDLWILARTPWAVLHGRGAR